MTESSATLDAARLFKCLADEIRLRLLRVLAGEELNVGELTAILDVPQSTLSRHLGVLRSAGLVRARRDGPSTFYSLQTPNESQGFRLLDAVRGMCGDDARTADDDRRLAAVLEARRERVREHFEREGDAWDALHRATVDPTLELRAINRILPRGQVLVDAGCGSGDLLPELHATGARIIAVDNAPSRLAKARRRAAEDGLDRVEFREGDLAALPVDDASADGVFCHLVLHHAPQPETVIREMRRVLKPGGRAVICDFLPHDQAWLREEHAHQWLGFDPDDVATMLRRAGFADIGCTVQAYAAHRPKGGGRRVADLRVFIMNGVVPDATTHNPSEGREETT